MADIKLFRIDNGSVVELPAASITVEKSLQTLLEKHLEAFLGVRLLASEYTTGRTHGGRIDTLGLDDNDCPEQIEWDSPRLLCIAADFTKYDEHAVQHINRNIELLRYRRYGDGLLLLELINSDSSEPVASAPTQMEGSRAKIKYKSFTQILPLCSTELKDLMEALRAFLVALGDEVQNSSNTMSPSDA